MSEIINTLKEAAGFKLEKTKIGYHGTGAINHCEVCRGMKEPEYLNYHYPRMKAKLESLPWTKVVSNPRNPKPEEYPSSDGQYIVMLDCDEHFVLINEFIAGRWTVYHNTHVKWWMPLPDDIDEAIK